MSTVFGWAVRACSSSFSLTYPKPNLLNYPGPKIHCSPSRVCTCCPVLCCRDRIDILIKMWLVLLLLDNCRWLEYIFCQLYPCLRPKKSFVVRICLIVIHFHSLKPPKLLMPMLFLALWSKNSIVLVVNQVFNLYHYWKIFKSTFHASERLHVPKKCNNPLWSFFISIFRKSQEDLLVVSRQGCRRVRHSVQRRHLST